MNVVNIPKLYTEHEASIYLRCSRATVKKLRLEGKLKFQTIANKVVFTENHILDLLGLEPIDLPPQSAPMSALEFPPIPILEIDSLRALGSASSVEGCGVYFLWLGNDLVYIGQSERVAIRVSHHRQACEGVFARSMDFEFGTALPIQWPYHLSVEAAYIRAYPTKYNRKQ